MTRPSLDEGTEIVTARRTITETDIVAYAGLSNDFNALHTDEVFAREESPFGGRVAHGQLVASIVTGLRSELDDWPVLSYLGASRRFTGPVRPGDTIGARYRVVESRPSGSRPDARVVTLAIEVDNDRSETVMTGEDVMLVAAAPSAGDA